MKISEKSLDQLDKYSSELNDVLSNIKEKQVMDTKDDDINPMLLQMVLDNPEGTFVFGKWSIKRLEKLRKLIEESFDLDNLYDIGGVSYNPKEAIDLINDEIKLRKKLK